MKGLILFVVASCGCAAFASSSHYKINAKIIVDGKIVSNPQMLVNEGELAEMQIPGTRLRVVATDVADQQVKNEILMKFNLEYKSDTQDIKATPQVLAKSGAEFTLRLGEKGGAHVVQMKVVASRE